MKFQITNQLLKFIARSLAKKVCTAQELSLSNPGKNKYGCFCFKGQNHPSCWRCFFLELPFKTTGKEAEPPTQRKRSGPPASEVPKAAVGSPSRRPQ